MTTTNNTAATTTATNEATSFEFRNKFEKLLSNENRSAIVDGFKNFCRLNPDAARRLLWNLTYREDLSYSFDKLGMKPELIPAENLQTFRNELRHQYQQRHPDFLETSVPGSCKEAFDGLCGSTDLITAVVVYDKIVSRLFASLTMGDPKKTLSLLESDKENYYFGGLRDMDFTREEAIYLKAFHEKISKLSRALYEHHLPNIPLPTPNQPFAGLAEKLEEVGFQYAPEQKPVYGGATPAIPVTPEASCDIEREHQPQGEPQHSKAAEPVSISVLVKSGEVTPCSVTLTAQNILAYKEEISSLVFSSEAMALLKQLRACGFDLNEVVEKEAKIKTLLESVNDLST